MKCEECELHVSGLIDGEIHGEAIREVFQHLATCDGCWTYYRRAVRLHAAFAAESENGAPAFNRPGIARDVPVRHHALSDKPPSPSLSGGYRKSVASFWLGAFVAFVFGILVTLLLIPGGTRGSQNAALEAWDVRLATNVQIQSGVRR